ncbi:MAG: transcription antitermination factor NusB [Firmicutes bacterium]|nr:transcription antitermination factor NusB [Bacillota bacterium]
MSRRLIRETVFSILFQVDLGRSHWRDVLEYTLAESEFPENSISFLTELVSGTIQHLKEIDTEITRFSEGWKLERMASTDRNILRMAVYEIKYRDDIPPGVSVNEAVDLAKKFGDEESGKFVNGILGNLVRTLNIDGKKASFPPEKNSPGVTDDSRN